MPRIETDSGILLVCDVCNEELDKETEDIYGVPGEPQSVLCEEHYRCLVHDVVDVRELDIPKPPY